jgi:hypothetical protein
VPPGLIPTPHGAPEVADEASQPMFIEPLAGIAK